MLNDEVTETLMNCLMIQDTAINGLRQIAAELHAAHLELSEDNRRATMDQAAFHAEQLAWVHEAERVLSEATHRPITVDEARLLAWCGNLQFNLQEKTNEMGR